MADPITPGYSAPQVPSRGDEPSDLHDGMSEMQAFIDILLNVPGGAKEASPEQFEWFVVRDGQICYFELLMILAGLQLSTPRA